MTFWIVDLTCSDRASDKTLRCGNVSEQHRHENFSGPFGWIGGGLSHLIERAHTNTHIYKHSQTYTQAHTCIHNDSCI